MTVKEKRTKLVKQLSVLLSEQDSKIVKGTKTVADSNIKMKAVEKRAENVAYERDSLQARLQQSLRAQDKVCKNVTRIQMQSIASAQD